MREDLSNWVSKFAYLRVQHPPWPSTSPFSRSSRSSLWLLLHMEYTYIHTCILQNYSSYLIYGDRHGVQVLTR